MKKVKILLSALLLAFAASACSESPMGVSPDEVELNGAEATWSTTTWNYNNNTNPNQLPPPPPQMRTNGYALGM